MALTDTKVRTLKSKEAPFKLGDSDALYLLVQPNRSKLLRLAYRFLGKQKTLALGQYPAVSLREARHARDAAKDLLAKGLDPSIVRKSEKCERTLASGNTFAAVAEEWFEHTKDRWVDTYSSRLRGRLNDDLIPILGKRSIAEIEPLEVLDAIRRIERRDAIEMAKRVMQMRT
jgi:hypothetical protein